MTPRVRNCLLGVAFFVLGAAMIGIICLDSDGWLAPGIFFPLLTDVVLCFLVGVFSKRAVWRFLAWLIIPVVVAFGACGPYLAQGGEAGGWAFLGLIYLLISGVVASGLACILGYYAHLEIKRKAQS